MRLPILSQFFLFPILSKLFFFSVDLLFPTLIQYLVSSAFLNRVLFDLRETGGKNFEEKAEEGRINILIMTEKTILEERKI